MVSLGSNSVENDHSKSKSVRTLGKSDQPRRARVICLSHKEDVDGLASSILITAAYKSTISVILVDYANIISRLNQIVDLTSGFDGTGGRRGMLFICDLGLNKKVERRFVESIEKIIANGYKVTYVDHHDINQESRNLLKKTGVKLIHSLQECTSVQIYKTFKRRLDPSASFFAAAGALTDYMEDKPIASSIVSRYDRQFLMLEATALAYMISANQHDDEFLQNLVNVLSQMKYPHEIEGGFLIAQRYAKKISEGVKSLRGSIVKRKNLAYAQSTLDLASSMVVNFVLGVSEKPAAMVYKFRDEIKSYVVSIRGSKDCKTHLGRLVNDVALELGGSGGGHDRACGAVVPRDKLETFIELLDNGIK
ncbi:MAG TPA: DHH family phosphoesterase [Nitrososphaeraceae archaeon]|jgi:RecJ-like exonuclease